MCRGEAGREHAAAPSAARVLVQARGLQFAYTDRSSLAAWTRRRDMDAATDGGLFVPARGDRFQQQRKVFGVMPFTIKVSSSDTAGRLLIIEQDNAYPGGPPRHVHHEQEEWFCAVQGTYVVEVGGQAHRLAAGDS